MKIQLAKRTQSGMTIVDVVIATFILAVMGVGLMGSFTYGFFAMKMARENQRATQILLEKVETIRLYRWDQVLTPGFIPDSFTDVYDPQAPTNAQGVVYSGTVIITNAPFTSGYSDNVRQLVVTLSWNTASNFTRSRTLSTLVAKDGIQNYVY